MFTRFRQTRYRLQVSLVETRRADGKVRHEHIASLGSVPISAAVADRIAFWQKLHERLEKLANRVDAATQGKVLGDVHARIPMVTPDEQRALQLENAEANARFWSNLHGMNAGTAEDHKGLAAEVDRHTQRRCRSLYLFELEDIGGVVWIPEKGYARDGWNSLLENLQPLGTDVRAKDGVAGDISSRSGEAWHDAARPRRQGDRMTRRVVTLLGGGAPWPLAGRAQQTGQCW